MDRDRDPVRPVSEVVAVILVALLVLVGFPTFVAVVWRRSRPTIAEGSRPALRDPWFDVLVRHDDVVDRLPAGIRADFRPRSPLVSFGITGEEAVETLAARWRETFASSAGGVVLGPGVELIEVRDLSDPEPRFIVGQRGHLLSEEGVTELEVVSVADDGTVEVRSPAATRRRPDE